MLKLTLDYVDFDGHKQTTDLFFNISQRELADKEVRSDGTWFDSLKAISEASQKNEASGQVIMDRFDEIIGLAYGKREGEYFRKSPAILEDFKSTAAYDAFFMKVCTDAAYATEFITAVLPAEMVEAVKRQQAEAERLTPRPITEVELPTQPTPPVVWPPQA